MNMQAMVKQAKKMQDDMMKAKKKIDETEFESVRSFVTVTAMGNKEIKNINIDLEEVSKDDIEIIEDLVLVAVNDVISKIDNETESKMGQFTKGMPGLF